MSEQITKRVKIDNNNVDKWIIYNKVNKDLCSWDTEPNTDNDSLSKRIWKNPKPNKVNKRNINVGDRVLIDSYPLNLNVTKVEEDKIFTDLYGSTVNQHNKEEVFPIYIKSKKDVKPGDIVSVNGELDIVRSIKEDVLTLVYNANTINIKLIEDIYGFDTPKEEAVTFSDGTVLYKDDKFSSTEELRKKYSGLNFKIKEEKVSLDYYNISKFYKISHEDIIPKEKNIFKKLKTALDHPLNVKSKEWALLVGASGSGKTEIAISYANSKNKVYIKQQGNAQLTNDDFIGYKSITDGTYFPSLLRDAVENGKIYILDEIDSCNSNTLLTLDGLKQEYFQFPDKLVKIHEDFRFIATANTLEYSEEYSARVPLDKAILARFDIIKYDMKPHELALRYGFEYVKQIENINDITPRDVSRLVIKMKIKEEEENVES